MNKSKIAVLFSLLAIVSMTLASCAAPAPQIVVQTQVVVQTAAPVVQTQVVTVKETQVVTVKETQVVQVTAPPKAEAKPIVSWLQYDAGNIDPKADEHVGNDYLRKAVPAFNKTFEGKWVWDQQYTPWDKHEARLIAAVNSGSDVPDFTYIGYSKVNLYYSNGTLQDLTDWAKAQSWWGDLDPNALKLCTGPDGKLYCIPVTQTPVVTYVWKDAWPNGFPTTPDQMLTEAARLQKEGKYAMTLFANTGFGGDGANRGFSAIVQSFGGGYDDGKGKMLLNTPENVAAITWLREMVAKKYIPEVAFAGNFQEESAFMDGSAGAFPTGLFGYRYLNPLTSPTGKKFEKKSEQDFIDAVAAGDAMLAPFPAAPGKKPGCANSGGGLSIPVGAKNMDGAHEFINWLMAKDQNVSWVLGPGGGLPTLKTVQAAPEFQTPFWKEASAAVAASACSATFPTIANSAGAGQAVANVIYELVKKSPTADIATALQKAQDDFNATIK
jgi:multiple sugar transport system substrate-binding protein